LSEHYAIRVYKQYFNFASAHFLIFADGSREPLHGHNYQVQVLVEGALGDADIVVDFIPFKPLVRRICDSLDHKTLLPRDNAHLEITTTDASIEVGHTDGSRFVFPASDVLILPIPNTSTEMLARFIGREMAMNIPKQLPEAEITSLEVQVEESAGQSGICRIRFSEDD